MENLKNFLIGLIVLLVPITVFALLWCCPHKYIGAVAVGAVLSSIVCLCVEIGKDMRGVIK